MAFQKGHERLGGRAAGTPNKLTASVKEAFGEAFEKLGGAVALAEWAKTNKTEFYKLASKLIPTELTGAIAITPEARVYPKQPINESGLPITSEAMDSVH